jgi:Histidine phosphatase superfamily (branch 1)
VYVSPYRRTQQTAELICAELSPRPRPALEERIREKEFGIFEGLTKHGSQARHPEEWARREKIGKYYYRPPVGESFPDVNLRVYSFLGTLIREHAGQLVLVVTHSVDFKGLKALADIAGRRFHRGLVLYLGRQAVAFGPICPGSDGDGAPRGSAPLPVPAARSPIAVSRVCFKKRKRRRPPANCHSMRMFWPSTHPKLLEFLPERCNLS